MAEPSDEPNRNEKKYTASIELKRSERIIGNRKRKLHETLSENPSSSKVTVCDFDESSYTTLDTLEGDCLREICEYLNIGDTVNLALTCKRITNFFETDIFPRKAKQVSVRGTQIKGTYFVKSPLDEYSSTLTEQSIETLFSNFGKFVKVLTLTINTIIDPKTWSCCMFIMKCCKNLTSLRFSCVDLREMQCYELQQSINNFQNLEILDLDMFGITDEWCALKGLPKVEKLTFLANNRISEHFIDTFRNLSNLTIIFSNFSEIELNVLAAMLDNNSHCLKNLKLLQLRPDLGREYSDLAQLLSNKVPNTPRLMLGLLLIDSVKHLIRLPNLKCLDLDCANESRHILFRTVDDSGRVNSLLRMLSDIGCIEELTITEGDFDDDDPNGPPLNFHKLQSLCLCDPKNISGLMNLLTRSELSTIHTLVIMIRNESKVLNYELLRFIESKITLKLIRIEINGQIFPIEFLHQIIDISERTFRRTLKFQLKKEQPGARVMRILKANRNLIKFELV